MRTLATFAFVVGMCLTGWTCALVMQAQEASSRSRFQRDTEKVASDTNVRLQTYFDMLLSIKGTFAINDRVGRDQFVRFVNELNLKERYPGFQAIQFVRHVPAAQLASFEAAVKGDTSLEPGGYPGFDIHPKIDRPDHYIIEYTEPMKGNENAFGLDLAGLAPHREALELGRDTGRIVSTERIILVQDATGQPGFVARAPVYRRGMPTDSVEQRRAALVGWVAIVFRVKNLMHEVIEPELFEHMTFRIHDAGNVSAGASAPAAASNIMFNTTSAKLAAIEGLTAERRLRVAQRQWVASFGALSGSRYSTDLAPVLWIAGGGTVVSLLIALLLLLASSRSRVLASQLSRSLEEQRAFQDSASVGIALFDEGRIVRCNRGMEEMLGYGKGELVGNPVAVLTGDARGPSVFAADIATRRWQSELELVRKDGSSIWCMVSGKAFNQGQLSQGGVWAFQDVSDRKSTEAALVDARDGLELSLGELARQKASVESAHSDLSSVLVTLKQAQTNLITSEKMASLGSLVAGIAHELNTPIGNSLLTATALDDMVVDFERKLAAGGVKRSALAVLLADTKQACIIMTNSLRRAADLITSFKQVAVDQTSDKRRRFDFAEVLHDTLATFAAQLRRMNCDVDVDCPKALALDSYPGSVGQVLSNLINNVLLHAFEGRTMGKLAITVRETDDDQVLLVFSDDGVGMSPKVLHQVFDPFFTTKMGQGGSGLGMNIVYNIVTGMLGGSIDIESSTDHGTSVTIKIPRLAPRLEGVDVEFNAQLM